MSAFFAYGLLVAGGPIFISWALLYGPGFLLEKMQVSDEVGTCYYMCRSVVDGALSLLIACFIFELLQVEPTIWIPVILQVVFVIWKMSQDESFMLMFITPGIIAGYYLFPYVRPHISQW